MHPGGKEKHQVMLQNRNTTIRADPDHHKTSEGKEKFIKKILIFSSIQHSLLFWLTCDDGGPPAEGIIRMNQTEHQLNGVSNEQRDHHDTGSLTEMRSMTQNIERKRKQRN